MSLAKKQPIIQNEEEYAMSVAKLRVWCAEMQATKLATHSNNRTLVGYVLHLFNDIADTFGFTMYNNTPVLVVPDALQSWFGKIPWRSIVCSAGRMFLITEIENERFSLSLPLSETVIKLANLDKIDITYMQVKTDFAINSFVAINFNYNPTLISAEAYYEAI